MMIQCAPHLDCQPAIQAAHDALPREGGDLVLEGVDHRLASGLAISRPNTRLLGPGGRGSQWLVRAADGGNAATPAKLIYEPAHGTAILVQAGVQPDGAFDEARGFQTDGVSLQGPGANSLAVGIHLRAGCPNALLQRGVIGGFGVAVQQGWDAGQSNNSASRTTLRDMYLLDSDICFLEANGCCVLFDNVSFNHCRVGIETRWPSEGEVVVRNRCYFRVKPAGRAISFLTGPPGLLTVEGNVFETEGGMDLYAEPPLGMEIRSILWRGNWQHGRCSHDRMVVKGPWSGVDISGNEINFQTGGAAIFLQDDGELGTINANRISNVGTNAIRVGPGRVRATTIRGNSGARWAQSKQPFPFVELVGGGVYEQVDTSGNVAVDPWAAGTVPIVARP